MTQTYETLLVEQDGGVLEVTLNRPDKYNALTSQLAHEMIALCERAEKDDSIRAILITGAGKGFCAGQDLDDSISRPDGYSVSDHLNDTYNPMAMAMRNLPKPILIAVNGACAGAGFGLALAGDLRFASDKALFLTAFIGIGLAPDTGVSFWLPRLVGPARAAEMLYTNKRIPGAEAAEIGLVNKVVPHDELMTEARAMAQKLAANPTVGIGLTKKALLHSTTATLQEQLDYEGQLQNMAAKTADYKEGVAAFRDKRKPNFQGK